MAQQLGYSQQQSPTTTSPSTSKSVALIICSTRSGRINPAIARYIASLLSPALPSHLTLSTVDLKPWNLPLFNESTVPALLPQDSPTSHYATAHTRAWSAEISRHASFVFVTPQYNWGVPATIKNAVDYLYHEWRGKPAVVVSYGGHGRGKCRAALEMVLTGLKMRIVKGWEVTAGRREMGLLAEQEEEGREVKEKEVDVDEETRGKWKAEGVEEEVARAWGQVLKMLAERV